MNKNNYCVIMAGGVGSRFWPLSRNDKPKQFIDILGLGMTFIQMTYKRFSRFIPCENFRVVTGVAYRELVLEQLPMLQPDQVLVEPVRRNTAPCIAYATYKLYKENPEATVVVASSDQLILDEERFEGIVCKELAFAESRRALMTIGITPSFPATGYGYIQVATKQDGSIIPVIAFREKPDLKTAMYFLQEGNYSWNSGIFIWSLASIKEALERYLPDIAEAFSNLYDYYGTDAEQEKVNEAYESVRSISIDYGLMEQADNVYVACADLGWSDVGTWGSLYQQLEKDTAGNAVGKEDVLITDSSNCLIKELNGAKTVVVDGMEDCLIVDTEDVLLVCRKGDEEYMKSVINRAIKQKQFKA